MAQDRDIKGEIHRVIFRRKRTSASLFLSKTDDLSSKCVIYQWIDELYTSFFYAMHKSSYVLR